MEQQPDNVQPGSSPRGDNVGQAEGAESIRSPRVYLLVGMCTMWNDLPKCVGVFGV